MPTATACAPTMPEAAFDAVEDLQPVIDYLRATAADDWNLDTVRSEDGTKNCFFGHLFEWATTVADDHAQPAGDQWSSRVWEAFEERWATTYAIYPVNDGTSPRYPQPTPRERVIAFLEALRDNREPTTAESMELDFLASIAADND